jgi:Site-specific recombinases, DNA invertase Pin homologs
MKVAIYARVSTDEGEQDPETQLLHLRKYAETFGHKIVAEYVDRKSGRTIRGRTSYIKMMEDAETTKFEAIIGYKLDRFHRNTMNAIAFVDRLRGLNKALIVTSQNIDTNTAMGRAMMQITAVFAELESANTSERSKIGTERAKAEGKLCHRPRKKLSAYQIDKAKGILAGNPDISRRQLALQFDGIGRDALIRELIAEGIL